MRKFSTQLKNLTEESQPSSEESQHLTDESQHLTEDSQLSPKESCNHIISLINIQIGNARLTWIGKLNLNVLTFIFNLFQIRMVLCCTSSCLAFAQRRVNKNIKNFGGIFHRGLHPSLLCYPSQKVKNTNRRKYFNKSLLFGGGGGGAFSP